MADTYTSLMLQQRILIEVECHQTDKNPYFILIGHFTWNMCLRNTQRAGCFPPKKDPSKYGSHRSRQQAVFLSAAVEMNTGDVLCFQSRMQQLDSALSHITVGHNAHECLINQMYRSITFHCEQTKTICSDTQFKLCIRSSIINAPMCIGQKNLARYCKVCNVQ